MTVATVSRLNVGSCQNCTNDKSLVLVVALSGASVRLCVACAAELHGKLHEMLKPTPICQPVKCRICGTAVQLDNAHRNGEGWIGNCCWDNRLREG